MQQWLLFQGKLSGTRGMWQQISSQQKFGRSELSCFCLTGLNSPLLVVLASRSANRFKAAWREGRMPQQCQMKNLAVHRERIQNPLDWKENMKTMAAPTEKLRTGRTGRLQLHFQRLSMWLFPVVFSCKIHLLLAGIGTSGCFCPWSPVSAVGMRVLCEVGIKMISRTLGQSSLIKVVLGSLMSSDIEIKTMSTSYLLYSFCPSQQMLPLTKSWQQHHPYLSSSDFLFPSHSSRVYRRFTEKTQLVSQLPDS